MIVTIEQLEKDIAEAERLAAEKVKEVVMALRRGENTKEAEARHQKVVVALELMRSQRRQLVRRSGLPLSDRKPAVSSGVQG